MKFRSKNQEEAKKIQDYLFNLGYKWEYGIDKEYTRLNEPYFFVSAKKLITFDDDHNLFSNDARKDCTELAINLGKEKFLDCDTKDDLTHQDFKIGWEVIGDQKNVNTFEDMNSKEDHEFKNVSQIQDDRENDYGDAKESHENIAKFWNLYLERKKFSAVFDNLDATDVAVMLSLMKASRLAFKRKHDSFLDFASYADFALKFETEK